VDVECTIRHYVAARLEIPEESVDIDAELRSLPKFDSIHALQIVLDVEQHLGIEIEDYVVFQVHTVREFASAVSEIAGAGARGGQ
jgi:acyl carrier protein